ncbi:hypothetical protein CC86DRAFT_398275 [Ophiobolus disseminans]|uniref:Uncharacterized protein n=1 Tax=Ophiobolus disseminans TaxID=1469910 RepID=A0A6A6ZFY5_9PLEO|nr:hypothetical protein CC86DRAFT_398275 [Ophiobolus disseminans]
MSTASHHLRQLLRAPVYCRINLFPPARPQARTYALLAPSLPNTRSMSLPRIVQPSFWISMVPKPLRSRSDAPGSYGWNPATPYIVLGLLVGSQAIQILWLKQEKAHSLRRAEAKIGLLREVIERVQSGEDVPVESMLGTGDVDNEKAWAEVLHDIENEEILFQSKKRRKALRQAAAEEATHNPATKDGFNDNVEHAAKVQVEHINGVRFY